MNHVITLLEIHGQRAIATAPPPEQRANILAGQEHYCSQQRQNDKTQRVLEKAFGSEWGDHYMIAVLFGQVAV